MAYKTEKYNFRVHAGASYTMVFTWKDSNGDRVNLRGYSMRMEIMLRDFFDDVIVELTTGNGGIVLEKHRDAEGSAIGTFTVHFTPEQTFHLQDWTFPFYEGVYDILVENPLGHRFCLLRGKVLIEPQVTR